MLNTVRPSVPLSDVKTLRFHALVQMPQIEDAVQVGTCNSTVHCPTLQWWYMEYMEADGNRASA